MTKTLNEGCEGRGTVDQQQRLEALQAERGRRRELRRTSHKRIEGKWSTQSQDTRELIQKCIHPQNRAYLCNDGGEYHECGVEWKGLSRGAPARKSDRCDGETGKLCVKVFGGRGRGRLSRDNGPGDRHKTLDDGRRLLDGLG